ncbi:fimbrial protein [Paraherbaspirillum soli]|uniref:Fimbrial protein n=1 Tax=Paraherbaspirillum soli TaxID=631222 RepID=A0ABW0MEE1_9BURK
MKLSSLAIAASLCLCTAGAMAADGGNINFTGKIVATTCEIPSGNIDVPMGVVTKDALAEAGTESAPVPFKIQLNKCDTQLEGVRVTFEGQTDENNSELLKIGTGAPTDAAGVAIKLADKDDHAVAINSESQEYQLAPGDNSLDFKANYVSTETETKAGAANATAAFKVTYR